MDDLFQINLCDYSFGPGELDKLLEEWTKDPKPKIIHELARLFIANRIKIEKGYFPYDFRNKYEKGDMIIVKIREGRFSLAQVVGVDKGRGSYNDGFSYDGLELILLDQATNLTDSQKRTYISNYHGKGTLGPAITSLQIIEEKDENEVIPKILSAISNDNRFITFRDKWLPKQLLITNIKDKLTQVEEIIAKAKRALSTSEILVQLLPDDNRDKLNSCLEFSLNYFLNQDKKFTLILDSVTKWDLREPPPTKIQSTVTVGEEWIVKGILIVPKTLSSYMEGTNTAHIMYDQIDEVLPYEEDEKVIDGLKDFYSAKAVAEFDKIHLRLDSLNPTRLFISSTWQRSLDKLLSIEPQDLDWEHSSLRDCIIVTLAKFRTPAHYREIYSEIAPHKKVSLSSIGATLSRYSPSVFAHVAWGKWKLAGHENKLPKGNEAKNGVPPPIPDEEIWKVVQLIEENDYVYKLLEKIRKPLSFGDICDRLASLLKVDANKLKDTAFLKANDTRLRRLDNGTWALEEWFKQPPPAIEEDISVPTMNENVNDSVSSPETPVKSGVSRQFLTLLLIVLFLITIASVVLFWLFF